MLLYLTPDDWREADGGQLRIHGAGDAANGGLQSAHGAMRDVAPTAGTLVLFDSAAVPHEVLPTRRERTVVVGWFLEPRDA